MNQLKNKLRKLYHNNWIFQILLFPVKKIITLYRQRILSDEEYINYAYTFARGYRLNFNHPETLSEKIQWLKLYDRTPLHTICADKLKVRDYIKEKIGEEYLIPLVFSTKDWREINPDNLPDFPVIIKTNHNSASLRIIYNKEEADFKEIRKFFRKKLKENFYYRTREWQYKNIEPNILVEKLLINNKGEFPNDYKFHCFMGKVEFIQVDIDRFKNHIRFYYNTNWEELHFTWNSDAYSLVGDNSNGQFETKPHNLDLMIKLAEKLAEDFLYVRIDFYYFERKIYFGEITFHHGGGLYRFSPNEWDLKLGNLVKLPINESV